MPSYATGPSIGTPVPKFNSHSRDLKQPTYEFLTIDSLQRIVITDHVSILTIFPVLTCIVRSHSGISAGDSLVQKASGKNKDLNNWEYLCAFSPDYASFQGLRRGRGWGGALAPHFYPKKNNLIFRKRNSPPKKPLNVNRWYI